jgi:hypothetical protein
MTSSSTRTLLFATGVGVATAVTCFLLLWVDWAFAWETARLAAKTTAKLTNTKRFKTFMFFPPKSLYLEA